MATAYFDCFAGISGNMTLAAFHDLGVPVDWLQIELEKMLKDAFTIELTHIRSMGIQAPFIGIVFPPQPQHRHFNQIKKMIEHSPYSQFVKTLSLKIFNQLAQCEAKVHGCPVEKVHFHEKGGIDTIVDIVGTALCIEHLKIDTIYASKLPLGCGFTPYQHGILPIPAPATLEILKNVPVYGSPINQELVTPTGAAIIKTLATSFGEIPELSIHNIGYGARSTDIHSRPNLLRILLGDRNAIQTGAMLCVETCIDDMNPEIFGYLMEQLFNDGAVDVWWVPIFMKKNRPATKVQILCPINLKDKIAQRIFRETTTLGIRFYPVERKTLNRKISEKDTPFGKIPVKEITEPDGSVRIVPEYEVAKKIAMDKDLPIRTVYEAIMIA